MNIQQASLRPQVRPLSFGAEMTQDESEQIEDLILVWFHWSKAHREQLGYSRVSPGFVHAQTHEVYDDNDDRNAKLARYTAEQVEACINTLDVLLRAAVGIHAANKAAGASVFRSPRLTRDEQHAMYKAAKDALFPMFVRRNLVS